MQRMWRRACKRISPASQPHVRSSFSFCYQSAAVGWILLAVGGTGEKARRSEHTYERIQLFRKKSVVTVNGFINRLTVPLCFTVRRTRATEKLISPIFAEITPWPPCFLPVFRPSCCPNGKHRVITFTLVCNTRHDRHDSEKSCSSKLQKLLSPLRLIIYFNLAI